MTAFAAKVHIRHRMRDILVLGALTILIDVDHFIGLERAAFHNVFVTLLLPLIIVVTAFTFKTNYNIKGLSILLLIFLSSHLFLDAFSEGPVALFYPLSDQYYNLNFNISVPLNSRFTDRGYLISTMGIGILAYFIIIFLPCLFLDDIIDISTKSHEKLKKGTKTFFRRLLRY